MVEQIQFSYRFLALKLIFILSGITYDGRVNWQVVESLADGWRSSSIGCRQLKKFRIQEKILSFEPTKSFYEFASRAPMHRLTKNIVIQRAKQDYWSSEDEPWKTLDDPPPPKVLQAIQEAPHRGGFEPTVNVDWYAPEIIQGRIPSELRGTVSVAGPGRIRIGGSQFGHWFDGDGYVTSLVLDGTQQRAWFCGRYVETQRYKDQEAFMKKASFDKRGQVPLAFSGAWTKKGSGFWYENLFEIPKNPSNTAIMWISPKAKNDSPRMFALCEGGQPVELDPHTLHTIGPETKFDQNIKSFFSAHFSRCPSSEGGTIYNHGYVLRPFLSPQINVMKLMESNDGLHLIEQRNVDLPYDTFIHDSVVSQNYLGYIITPWAAKDDGKMDLLQMMLGQKPLAKSFTWQPNRGTFLHLHSRNNMLHLDYKVRLPNDGVSLYHLVDLHDETNADGLVVRLRVAELEDRCWNLNRNTHRPTLEEHLGNPYADAKLCYIMLACRLKEYEFHFQSTGKTFKCSKVVEHDLSAMAGAAPCEFPVTNTHHYDAQAKSYYSRKRFCWTNVSSSPHMKLLDGIQKVDLFSSNPAESQTSHVQTFGEGCYAGAPLFIPSRNKHASEDTGYIISTVYCSKEHRSDVVILDSSSLEILCRIRLGVHHHVPYQFHGEFIQDFLAHS